MAVRGEVLVSFRYWKVGNFDARTGTKILLVS
jgi:hypothetical protein